ncbi:F-actin-monooxygenase MICAL2 isoform X3 [Brachyhypopomus gauderio]|uniref:F-actin-monooxygenase MICAL2 isoform X3 n=1 Tax=Brachyhypopomus gauderio TaxID=698409 RepID=UPI004041AE1E
MGEAEEEKGQAARLFENFVQASTCKTTLQAFGLMCSYLELDPLEHDSFYESLKRRLTCWRAKALWSKLDKRAGHKEYKKVQGCGSTKCLIIGGGPCGLRTAIELAFLGARAVVIEKRDTFSRNNVLHLWPFTIHDLKGLGAKKFYGKFCAGAIDHISIRQLQLMLLKIALLLGVEFHINVEFVKLLEPPEDQENEGPGWRAELRPADHPVANLDFDVVVGADGRRNTLEGFRRKEFRGKLAIAITANFINRNTTAEAKVEEISGVAFIFNQKFFLDLRQETGIDLENIVYYKDDTHYFVMTAKKQSLLDKGVIIHDYIDTEALLSSANVNQDALLAYAHQAADFATHYQLPVLEYAMNHLDQPDVAMFDFTCMYASENAALVREKFGHQLLVALVGDSLLEPFWPMGTGCARGFLAAVDTAWMVKGWVQGKGPLEVLAERESLYRLLPQTTPENITKNFEQYTIDPGTRYPNLNSSCVRPHQVRNYYISGELKPCSLERAATIRRPVNLARRESEVRPSRLLTWCQKHTEGYRGVSVTDLSTSWSSGLAFCALIHRFRAHLIDYDSLNEGDPAGNAQLAFDVTEREFGIKPFTTGKELASGQEPDKNAMVTYLSKFYELFRGTPFPPSDSRKEMDRNKDEFQPIYRSLSLTQPRKRIPKDEKKVDDNDSFYKRRRKVSNYLEEATNLSSQSSSLNLEGRELKENKVKFMASQLLAKFEQSTQSCTLRQKSDSNVAKPLRPASLDMTESLCFSNLEKKIPPPLPPKPAACGGRVEERIPLPPLLPNSSSAFNCRKPDRPARTDAPARTEPAPTRVRSHTQPTHTRTALHVQSDGAGVRSDTSERCERDSCPSAVRAVTAMLQRLQRVEEVISQKKAQTQNAREFHKKSIKEKAVHLSSLFSGDGSPPPQTWRMEQKLSQGTGCSNVLQPAHSGVFWAVGWMSLQTSSSNSTSTITPHHHHPQCTATTSDSSPLSSLSSLLLQQNKRSRCQVGQLDMKPCEIESQRQSVCRPCMEETQKQQTDGRRVLKSSTKTDLSTLPLHPTPLLTPTRSLPECTAASSPNLSPSSSSSLPKEQLRGPESCEQEMQRDSLKGQHMGSSQREPPQTLGDVCHVCKRRVYAVERLSAGGLFFHRDCVHRDTCSSPSCRGEYAFDAEQGRLYCKLHCPQKKCAVRRGSELNPRKVSEATVHSSPGQRPAGDESSLRRPAGTLRWALRRSMRWPLHVGRAVCATPHRLTRWLGTGARALRQHVRDNAEDYAYLYELLSVGGPLLVALHELMQQLWAEAGPLHLQPLQEWLEQHLGSWLLT